MTIRRRLMLAMALFPWLAADPAIAQRDCTNAVVNFVTVHFKGDSSRVPQVFTLKDNRLTVKVAKKENGIWRSGVVADGLVGNQYSLRPAFKMSGYKIEPADDVYQDVVAGECHAIYSFKLRRSAWIVEIRPTPAHPYEYQKNGAGSWIPVKPDPTKRDWMRVNLEIDDSMYVRVFEGPLYLFTVSDLRYKPSTKLSVEYREDQIADEVLLARVPYCAKTVLGPPPGEPPFGKQDPFVPLAETVADKERNSGSWLAARVQINHRLKLDSLTISDKTEED